MSSAAYAECGSPDNADSEELHQEAAVGFMKAVNTFKPESGYSFLTYAGECIRNRVINYLKKEQTETQKKFPVLTAFIENDESGNRLKINPADSDKYSTKPLYEVDYHKTPEELFFINLKKELLYSALKDLTDRQKQFITYRYGLNNIGYHTRESTADYFGITIDEAVKTEKEALSRLRKRLIPEFAFIVNEGVIEKIEYDRLAEKYPAGTYFITVYFQLMKENNASTECEYEYLITAPGESFTGKIKIDFDNRIENGFVNNDITNTKTIGNCICKIRSALTANYDEYGPLPNGVMILPQKQNRFRLVKGKMNGKPPLTNRSVPR